MAMAGRASADLVHEYVPPSTDPILVERDVTMDCKKMLRSVCLSAERWPASSRQRFGSAKWILCRLGSFCATTMVKFMLPLPAADGYSKNTPASARQDLNADVLYC